MRTVHWISVAMLAMLSSVSAQPRPRQRLYIEFGTCTDTVCETGSECCDFESERTGESGKFCMTEVQKDGDWTGTYVDNDNKPWTWQCLSSKPEEPKPQPPPPAPPAEVIEIPVAKEVQVLYSSYEEENDWILIFLYITYLSGLFWVFGYPVMFFCGFVAYSAIYIQALLAFFDVLFGEKGSWGGFMMGPVRRAINGTFIFWTNVALVAIPVVNFAAAPLLLWWAVDDYYDYYVQIIPLEEKAVEEDAAAA